MACTQHIPKQNDLHNGASVDFETNWLGQVCVVAGKAERTKRNISVHLCSFFVRGTKRSRKKGQM
jgi:hypothetical protein